MAAKKTAAKTAAKTTGTKMPARAKKAAGKSPPKTKKAAGKKAAAPGKKADKKPMTRAERIDALIAGTNSKLGHKAVHRASDYESSYLLRRPTGITSLDIALAGGIPASAPIVIVGPDGVGKDALLWRIAAETQRIYGDDFGMAIYLTEFKADKRFMKDLCGLKIAFTPEELDEIDRARFKNGIHPLTEAEREHYLEQVGNIVLCDSLTAEHGLDFIMDSIDTNAFQMVIVNSIGFLQTEAKEGTESLAEFAQQSNEAILISKFTPRCALHLNRLDEHDDRNETSVVLVNQVRAKREQTRGRPGVPTPEKSKYTSASNAHALKHGKALEIMLHKGKKHFNDSTRPPTLIGRSVDWEFTKGKLGTHDGITGTVDYFYDTGFDVYGDLAKCAVQYGVITQEGSWYTYLDEKRPEDNFKVQGSDNVRQYIVKFDLFDKIREKCFRAAGVVYRWR